ncbi:MAG: cysteine desulfurase [Gemmatimonadetes bacterium]|nr:cysteine desulfurase [Gemmatimonadota bacterium]
MATVARPSLDLDSLRREFPALQQDVNGRPLVYLDSAATAQRPRAVLEALRAFYEHDNANVHRGLYELARRATDAYEAARVTVARFLNAPSPAEVVWVRGTTEAINLVAASWGGANLRAGDEILVTVLEHHSNLVPWQLVAQRTGAVLRSVDIDDRGRLRLDQLDELLTDRTRIVAVGHASNALGTINPVREIADRAHAAGALVLVDGAQGAAHLPVDVQALGCDFYAFSGHKVGGPMGIGVLWGRRELLDAMPPYQGGGEMIARVELQQSTWAELPHKFEAGTPNVAGAVGLAAALDFWDAVGREAVQAHEDALARYALDRLRDVPGLRVLGPDSTEARTAVFSLALDGVHPHDIATILDADGIAIRAGHHCAQPLMRRLGVPATARASCFAYTTFEEIDRLAIALEAAGRIFA